MLGVGLLHLAWWLIDERIPGDRAQMFQQLGAAYLSWGRPSTELLRLLTEPTGWFNVGLAGVVRLLGPSPGLIRSVCMAWSLALVGLAALLARRLAGPWVALATVAILSTSNLIVALGRIVWFHIPEAALAVALASLLVGDPELRWRRSPWLLALGGALLLSLRSTGGFWLVTLLPLVWPSLRARRRPLIGVAASWALAALIPLRTLSVYLRGKLQARELYAELVPSLAEQLGGQHVGWLALALLAGAAAVGAWGLRSHRLALVVLLTWVLAPLALVGVFRSGIENHDVFMPALALLAAAGLVRGPRSAGLVLVGALVWQGLSQGLDRDQRRPLAGWVMSGDEEPVLDFQRPYAGLGRPEIEALFDASCDSDRPRTCLIVVHQGLFHPFSGSAGELELFLLQRHEVYLQLLHRQRPDQIRRTPRALAATVCDGGAQQELWLRRSPDSAERLTSALRLWELVEVWRAASDERCELVWYAPRGELARPELLPAR